MLLSVECVSELVASLHSIVSVQPVPICPSVKQAHVNSASRQFTRRIQSGPTSAALIPRIIELTRAPDGRVIAVAVSDRRTPHPTRPYISPLPWASESVASSL